MQTEPLLAAIPSPIAEAVPAADAATAGPPTQDAPIAVSEKPRVTAGRAAPQPVITAFTAEYRFTRNRFYIANLIHRFKPLGSHRYQFSSDTEAVGPAALFIRDKVRDQSTLALIDGRLRPVHYLYLHQRGNDTQRTEFNFDWVRNQASGVARNRPLPPTAIPIGTQDKLSYQLLLMFDLMAGKQELHYKLLEEKGLRDYEFDVVGHETLDTRIGPLETVKLVRRNDKRQSTFWCAEKFSYLPVRFTQVEKDGALLDLEITGISNLPWSTH